MPKSSGEKVYNFETKTHTYCLANGLVVHNCDTLSMIPFMDVVCPSSDAAYTLKEDEGIWSIEDTDYYEDSAFDSYVE